MPIFSVIIPVYNVASYLRECLDSLWAQSVGDWEAVCVDDGSTDGSGAILDEYAVKDARFKVLHRDNAGASSARNAGLEIACGKWICYLDADDVLAADYFSAFLELADKGDVNFFNLKCFGDDTRKSVFIPAVHRTKMSDGAGLLYSRAFNGAGDDAFGWTCNKFIRSEVAKSVRFNPEVAIFEDEVYALQICDLAQDFVFMDKVLYHYRIRPDGLTRTVDVGFRSAALVFMALMNHLKHQPLRAIARQRASWLLLDHANSTGQFRDFAEYGTFSGMSRMAVFKQWFFCQVRRWDRWGVLGRVYHWLTK